MLYYSDAEETGVWQNGLPTQMVAVAIIVVSVAVLAFVGFSIWTEP
jgi:hypothetical protein